MKEKEQQLELKILNIIKDNIKNGITKSGKKFGIPELEIIYRITQDNEFAQYEILRSGIEELLNIYNKPKRQDLELEYIKEEIKNVKISIQQVKDKTSTSEEHKIINKLTAYIDELDNYINKIEVNNVKR